MASGASLKSKNELTDKPGSVVDNHSSGINVTVYLKQPTRFRRGSRPMETYLVLLRVGLPCHCCYQLRGALLPHPFTLTCIRKRTIGGLLSAALSVGSRPQALLALYPLEPGLSSVLHPFKHL